MEYSTEKIIILILALVTMLFFSTASFGASASGKASASDNESVESESDSCNVPIQTIILEARSESLEGQQMVASVIKNRMRERHLTAKQVCLQPKQFSCWNKNAKRQIIRNKKKAVTNAKKAWASPIITKANLYCRYDCKPYWINKVEFVKRVGDHCFYYEKR